MENRPVIITHGRVRLAVLLALVLSLSGLAAAHQGKDRPSITLRATPSMVFAPARIVVTAEIKGGPDDFQDFYCAKVEWTWDDGTTSEANDDCDPYEAGKSVIRRRYAREHKFDRAGIYNVRFHLKQGTKTVGSGTIDVTIRDQDLPRR